MPAEGSFRSHQVPLAGLAENPDHLRAARGAGCAPTGPRSSSTRTAGCSEELRALRPEAERRMSANPHANGGAAAARPRAARLPRLRASRSTRPARLERGDPGARRLAARRACGRNRSAPTSGSSGPDETASNRLDAVFEVTDRAWHGRPRAGRRAPRARRPGDGGPERAPVPGLARGLPPDRPARALQLLRGVHPHRRLDVQPARQVAEGHPGHPLAAADRVVQLPALARTSGARTTTASRTRTPASSTTWSTRRPRSSASTCRPTPTACCR